MPLNYVTMRLKGPFIIEQQNKNLTTKTLTLGDETSRVCGPRWG